MTLFEALKKYVEESFSAPDSTIYHYTNFGKEIINSGHLKLSSHDALNKRNHREMTIGPKIARKELRKSRLHDIIPLLDEYISCGLKIYVISFCEEANYAHAIENYGKNWIGLKLEFAIKYINDYPALLGRVKYNIIEQKKIISAIIDLYISSPEEPKEKIPILFLWLSAVFSLLKEETDLADHECRIITYEIMDPHDSAKTASKPCSKEIKFNPNSIISNIDG